MNQHQTTIQHIELYLNKYRTKEDEQQRRDYMHKITGMLSLALALDIITIQEHEKYFNKIFNT